MPFWFVSFPVFSLYLLLASGFVAQVSAILSLYSSSFPFCCTGFLVLSLPSYSLGFFPFVVQQIDSQDMRIDNMKLSDFLFWRFVAEHETNILKGLLMVSVLPRISS
ncbi:hypothetical protein LXL04_022636 [Taraxacum kok-saghyz]